MQYVRTLLVPIAAMLTINQACAQRIRRKSCKRRDSVARRLQRRGGTHRISESRGIDRPAGRDREPRGRVGHNRRGLRREKRARRLHGDGDFGEPYRKRASYKNLPFDALNDFIGITPLTVQTGILIVHPSLPVKTVKDLIALAKAKPNQILYGSSGSGSYPASHDGAFQCDDRHENDACACTKAVMPRASASAAGELQAMVASMPIVRPHMAGNRIRVIAVCSESRMKQLPDIPTIAESGVPGYEFTAWVAAFRAGGHAQADRRAPERRNQKSARSAGCGDSLRRRRVRDALHDARAVCGAVEIRFRQVREADRADGRESRLKFN